MALQMENLRRDMRSLTAEEWKAFAESRGWPAFRGAQIRQWLEKGVLDSDKMTNLPQSIREELRKTFDVFGVNIEKKLVSQVDNTVKYLYALR